MSLCCLTKGITPKIYRPCVYVIINERCFEFLYVVGSQTFTLSLKVLEVFANGPRSDSTSALLSPPQDTQPCDLAPTQFKWCNVMQNHSGGDSVALGIPPSPHRSSPPSQLHLAEDQVTVGNALRKTTTNKTKQQQQQQQNERTNEPNKQNK